MFWAYRKVVIACSRPADAWVAAYWLPGIRMNSRRTMVA